MIEILDRPVLSRQERILTAFRNPLTIQRELNNRSLHEFIEYFWPVIIADEFKSNWHIDYLCQELEYVARRVAKGLPKEHDLVINIPPGTTKTLTTSIMFPVWCWTQWPWMRFITASYSSDLSLESAEKSRNIIRSTKFKELYPELELKPDKDTKGNYQVVIKGKEEQLGGNRFSTSVGGTLLGFHGHINIVDDPLNPKQAASEVELANANRWMSQTLSSRKTDKKVSMQVLIMQRLHQIDPSGYILDKNKKNVKHISLPGEIRNYKAQVKPPELIEKYRDELLDPLRMDWEVLADMEADFGQYGYAGQVGQKPTPPGGGMFKIENFNFIDSLPVRTNCQQIVRYWDKAGSVGKGCFTVGVKMSKWTNGKMIIEDVKRGQWGSEVREQIIKQTAQADGTNVTVYIEQEPGSGGLESAQATIKNLTGFSVYADRPTGDKAFRADPYSVQVNNGNIQILRDGWNKVFIDEHEFFPFSTYKDQVDSASGAFNHLTALKKAGTW